LTGRDPTQADQSEEDKKLVAHVRSKIEEVRASANRIAHEGIWMTNIAYLLGYDGIAFNSTTRQFQPVNRASNYLKKNRIHVNKILPTIQNRLARLCKNPPSYDVRPESNSTEDKEAARLSLQVLTTLWDKLTIDKKRILLYMWTQQCGHAWMKISWDDMAGRPMVNPMDPEATGYEGDVRADVVSPFEIFPDPMAKTDDDVLESWLIQAKVRKLDYFKAHYPEKGALVKEEDAWLLSAQYEQRINSLNNRGPSTSGMQESMKNSAIEMIKYEARSKDYPNGRMIICANGILLEDKELPVGEIPFRKFDDVVIGGKFYSESIITHMRPIQDNYNENKRRQSEWMKKTLAGKYMAPRGSGMAQEAMNDESGEIYLYDPVPNAPAGIQPIPIPSLPTWAFNIQKNDVEDMNDISGISEVSRGTLPSASIPAIGMQLLTEQDDTRLGVMTEQHEHAWAGIGGLLLKYVEKFYILPRKLKMSGPDLSYTVKDVSGQDLRGNTDVIVKRGSTLPGSKTLNRQDIMNVYQAGLLGEINDPKVREKVLDMLEFGDITGVWEDQALDKNQIKRAIDLLESGQPVNVNEFDNHVIWLMELNKYRKGDKWDSLDPNIQMLFMQTMEECIGNIVDKAMPPQPAVPPPMAQAPNAVSAPDGAQPMPETPPQPAGGPV
jgi:hypothetical protein